MTDLQASGTDVAPHVDAGSPSGLLTPGEVAVMLDVDANTAARWSERGHFRNVRTPGGHRRYVAADVLAFARRATP